MSRAEVQFLRHWTTGHLRRLAVTLPCIMMHVRSVALPGAAYPMSPGPPGALGPPQAAWPQAQRVPTVHSPWLRACVRERTRALRDRFAGAGSRLLMSFHSGQHLITAKYDQDIKSSFSLLNLPYSNYTFSSSFSRIIFEAFFGTFYRDN